MATASKMIPLGTLMPDFTLCDVRTGAIVTGLSLKGPRGVLVMFVCNHCPYVVHIGEELVRVAHEALDAGFSVVAINSNSLLTHAQDGPVPMKELATRQAWRFPFLFDESQAVARAFDAACTPDLYVFDADRRLAYRGQFDDARPRSTAPIDGHDLRAALAAVAAGRAPSPEQKPSMGCSIKWQPT
jgi:peroxiredoxin